MQRNYYSLGFCYVVFLLTSFALISCSDDGKDEQPEEKVFSIIGTWQCVDDEGEKFIFYPDGTCKE